jgi:hypothetical protein
MSSTPGFQVEADAAARAWTVAHPSAGPRVIAYRVTRCDGEQLGRLLYD